MIATCIYCGHQVRHGQPGGATREEAHRSLVEHDRQCPENPIAQELARLRAQVREVRNRIGDSPMRTAGHTAVGLLDQILRGEA